MKFSFAERSRDCSTKSFPAGGLMIPLEDLRTRMAWIILLSLVAGCDERVAEVAREAADRQAQQNTTMVELQQEVASGTRSLVAADAAARHEIVGVHHDLQAERRQLDAGWNALEAERSQIARNRRTESLVAPLAQLLGTLALVVVLLGFLWQLLARVPSTDPVDAELSELLIEQLLAEELPGPAIENRRRVARHKPEAIPPPQNIQQTPPFTPHVPSK
jgi:hypothetical protein